MTAIESITVEVDDLTGAEHFYASAFDLGPRLHLRQSSKATSGFRGFTLSLVVSRPATVRGFVDAALKAGATTLKPVAKSFWGYGGAVQAPDGTVWQVATSEKKDTGSDTGQVDQVVLLLGVANLADSKRFYVGQGLEVAKSFPRKYVEFAAPEGAVKLALYGRRSLAKVVGSSSDGTGAHRLAIASEAGTFTDPDGFEWEAAHH